MTDIFLWQNNVMLIIQMHKQKIIFFEEAVFWAAPSAWGSHAISDHNFTIKTYAEDCLNLHKYVFLESLESFRMHRHR